jgi:hypothetical protein
MASKQPLHSNSEAPHVSGSAPEKLHLPNDLYGLFVAEPLQLDASVDGWTIIILVMTRAFFFIVLNFIIQMLYVVKIHRLSVDLDPCVQERFYMQVVCVFVFGISIFRQLRDCIDFLALVVRCPVARDGGYRGIGRGADGLHRHGAVLSQERPSGTSSILNWARRRESSKTHVWTLGSMSYSWKVVCIMFVGMPRILFCSLFAKVGAGFIVRSPEIIIDTVGVLFVVEIGTFMYNAFTTNAVKQQLEQLQPIEWYPSNARRLAAFLFVNFAYPVLLICFSVAVVWYSRKSCGEHEDLGSSLADGEAAVMSDLMEVVDFFKEMVCLNC